MKDVCLLIYANFRKKSILRCSCQSLNDPLNRKG